MKKSILLILVFFWNHVCGHRLRCSTGVVITNQTISLLSSTRAGSKVFLLRKYQAPSLINCLEECCSGNHGTCSIVEYKKNSADANCFYYSCQPIRKCKFMDSEGTDTFTFPSVYQNSSSKGNVLPSTAAGSSKLKGTVLNENSTVHYPKERTFKDHTRAVAARKGVEPFTAAVSNDGSSASWKDDMENGSSSSTAPDNFKDHHQSVTARKGVETTTSAADGGSLASWKGFTAMHLETGDAPKSSGTIAIQDILSKTDVSFKNDNTTIKPRKGVEADAEMQPTVSSKIKPRKGVEVLYSAEIVESPVKSRSKVKPRKGAVPLQFSLTATSVVNKTTYIGTVSETSSSSTAPLLSTNHFGQTLPSRLTTSTDLISVLEEVFRDESPSAETSSKFQYGTRTTGISASNTFTVSSNSDSSMKYSENITIPVNSASASTDRNSATGITESPSKPFHTISPSKSSDHREKVLESTPPLVVTPEQLNHQSVSTAQVGGKFLNPSPSLASQTSMNAESERQHDKAVLLFTVSPLKKTKMSAVMSTADDSESERKYKSSMHLVLSLVFGLLVLFVVFGAVAKRVYDVWMRRHYHRMDFLIDGMYDGFS